MTAPRDVASPPEEATAPAATGAEGPADASSGLGEAIAEARPGDPLALLFARARVAGAIFGAAAGGLGRFRVLERLGAGGMGVVYAAYDPDLDRAVAIKLVAVPTRGRDVALAEAKALARLSHPHVVPVYDVGIQDDSVYFVMELVRGETLGVWARGRAPGAILDAYRQAGEALAAAHAAGLVHRDFKPDNAIVGSDGRVRVVDFGLACEAADRGQPPDGPRLRVGTPRYMAPEQAAGMPVTPAADQYSFCVALGEALGRDPADRSAAALPRWLAVVIQRGRALEPTARYGAMSELLRALARDPVRLRRRRAALAVVVAAVGTVAFVAGRQSPSVQREICNGGDAELAAAWSPDARARSLTRIAGLGRYGDALAGQLAQVLQDHTTRWVAGHRDACLAHDRGAQSDALLDRRMACLERGRAALVEVADLTERADATTLPALARAVRALPDPADCADLSMLLSDVKPPSAELSPRVAAMRGELARGAIDLAAGRVAQARAVAERCVAQARALGYPPLVAEALLTQGRALTGSDHGRAAAISSLVEATEVAMLAGADALAVEAWARRAWAQGTDAAAAHTTALAGLELMQVLAARTPSARFARALLDNNVGGVELARDRRDQARVAFERALTGARGVTGPAAVELLAVRSNLALVTDDPARRDTLLADAVAELTRLLGHDHPDTLQARMTRGMSMISLEPAVQLLTSTCEGYALHEMLGGFASECWIEVGYLWSELGDAARAVAAMERAAGGGPGSGAPELPYRSLWRGDASRAADQFAAELAAFPPATPDEVWWQRFKRAELQLGLGRARRVLGELGAARQALESSIAAFATIAQEHAGAWVDRRLGRARAELAGMLAAIGAKREVVAPIAAAAAAWLRRAQGRPAEIAGLDQLAAPR